MGFQKLPSVLEECGELPQVVTVAGGLVSESVVISCWRGAFKLVF